MKKQELKKILKPLIKECIKEVIFEDGVLSSVISEVMLASAPLGRNQQTTQQPKETIQRTDQLKNQKLQEQRKQMLDAIGKDAFNGVNIFEGTTPTPAPSGGSAQHGPLSGTDPRDPGVDITNFANSSVWKKLAGN